MLYGASFGLTKLAIATFLLVRTFNTPPTRIYRKLTWFVFALCAAWTAGCILEPVALCTSVAAYFKTFGLTDNNSNGDRCGNPAHGWTVLNVFDIVTDSLLIALPMTVVAKLWRISPAERRKAIALVSVGGATVLVALVRFGSIINTDYSAAPTSTMWLYLLCTLEMMLGLSASCLPAARFVWGRMCGDARRNSGASLSVGPINRVASAASTSGMLGDQSGQREEGDGGEENEEVEFEEIFRPTSSFSSSPIAPPQRAALRRERLGMSG